MTQDLFDDEAASGPLPLAPGAVVLRRFARPYDGALLDAVREVIAQAPLRHMVTPGGLRMSVAMANCGDLGWVSDRTGYRYDRLDPESGKPWPRLPDVFRRLAAEAASRAGFEGFVPDACLVNRYEPGTRLSMHQDRDERDFSQPIVSVSLGLSAVFLFGGPKRSDMARRVPLDHGDVVVWGGPARLHYHGVLPLKEGAHPFWDGCRINLTFRKAG
ncbi:DNA oxidative demethylase AlkB [Variovorax ureilyticus]|uniref:DNA oxidative demethylase AlkB n=1 Tax=Variovorax ureilyticus TaxID=1836198 RepID=A0ABU8V8Y2_9BURK